MKKKTPVKDNSKVPPSASYKKPKPTMKSQKIFCLVDEGQKALAYVSTQTIPLSR